MDKENLIELIVQKVIEELSKLGKLNSNLSKKSTVYFLGTDENLKNELEINNNVKKVGIHDVLEQELNNEDVKLVVSNLSIDEMIVTSQGYKSIIIDFLLKEKEVYIVKENVEFNKYNLQPKLKKLYNDHLKNIQGFGATLVSADEIVQIFIEKEPIFIDGVITESKLKKIDLKNKKIIISKDGKITSLAQDYIKQNKVEVKYERG